MGRYKRFVIPGEVSAQRMDELLLQSEWEQGAGKVTERYDWMTGRRIVQPGVSFEKFCATRREQQFQPVVGDGFTTGSAAKPLRPTSAFERKAKRSAAAKAAANAKKGRKGKQPK